MPKLIHYRDQCIGCGICHEMQPYLWRMSKKDGKAVLVHAQQKKKVHILTVHESVITESAATIAACPVGVIKGSEL